MTRILITGITGFVGSAVARRLVDEGHDVYGIRRSTGQGPKSDSWRINDFKDRCRLIYYTDLQDKKDVNLVVNQVKPDIVYHFAANEALSSPASAEQDIQTNIIGTWNLLQALSTQDIELFVNIGSSSEYGTKNRAMYEEDFLEPNSFHSFAKGAQTLLCQTMAKTEAMPITTLRLFSVYGPYEKPSRLISSVIRNTLTNQELDLSHPKVCRDFVYIDDVVDFCVEMIKRPNICSCKTNYFCNCKNGEIFNIGTGTQSSIMDIVNNVFEITGKSVACNWLTDSRSWDANTWVADCSKAKALLDWAPKHNLKEGLTKTIEWMKNNVK